MNETFETVRTMLVAEFQLDPSQVTPTTHLADLGVDSLAALEFVFALEDKFHITVAGTSELRGGVVQDVVDAVDHALSQMPAAAAAS